MYCRSPAMFHYWFNEQRILKPQSKTVNDTYIDYDSNMSNLKPAIVAKDLDGNINNTLTFDDVVNAIGTNFDKYNYASAYSTQPFVFNPPVNIDMLMNFSNYYWIQNLPTYVAENTGDANPILDRIKEQSIFKLEDDNNTFNLHNGMIIRFEGNWGGASDNTYIVSGVGTGIELILFQDSTGKFRYSNQYKSNIEAIRAIPNSKK